MRILDDMFEFDALPLDLVAQTPFLFLKRGAQFVFENGNLVENASNFIVHEAL